MTIEKLITENYEQRYFSECQYIWQKYVPHKGQADCLQGELLRAIEKIAYEAQNNGNTNWDQDFVYFCDFINQNLCKQEIFSTAEKEIINLITAYFKSCGNYAELFNQGKIPKSKVEGSKMAYLDENLYDIIRDKIGYLQKIFPNPIPFQKHKNLHR